MPDLLRLGASMGNEEERREREGGEGCGGGSGGSGGGGGEDIGAPTRSEEDNGGGGTAGSTPPACSSVRENEVACIGRTGHAGEVQQQQEEEAETDLRPAEQSAVGKNRSTAVAERVQQTPTVDDADSTTTLSAEELAPGTAAEGTVSAAATSASSATAPPAEDAAADRSPSKVGDGGGQVATACTEGVGIVDGDGQAPAHDNSVSSSAAIGDKPVGKTLGRDVSKPASGRDEIVAVSPPAEDDDDAVRSSGPAEVPLRAVARSAAAYVEASASTASASRSDASPSTGRLKGGPAAPAGHEALLEACAKAAASTKKARKARPVRTASPAAAASPTRPGREGLTGRNLKPKALRRWARRAKSTAAHDNLVASKGPARPKGESEVLEEGDVPVVGRDDDGGLARERWYEHGQGKQQQKAVEGLKPEEEPKLEEELIKPEEEPKLEEELMKAEAGPTKASAELQSNGEGQQVCAVRVCVTACRLS